MTPPTTAGWIFATKNHGEFVSWDDDIPSILIIMFHGISYAIKNSMEYQPYIMDSHVPVPTNLVQPE